MSLDTIAETVALRMKQSRAALNMTQVELAQKSGFSRQLIGKYERGDVGNMPLSSLRRIAHVLGVTSAYLIGWEEPSPALTQEERKRKELIQAIVANLERMSPEVLQRFLALIESFLTAPKA